MERRLRLRDAAVAIPKREDVSVSEHTHLQQFRTLTLHASNNPVLRQKQRTKLANAMQTLHMNSYMKPYDSGKESKTRTWSVAWFTCDAD